MFMVPFSAWNAPLLWGGDALALKGLEEPAVRIGRPEKGILRGGKSQAEKRA
jgi:hypothetical protein